MSDKRAMYWDELFRMVERAAQKQAKEPSWRDDPEWLKTLEAVRLKAKEICGR